MRKYAPTNSKITVDERGRVSFTTQNIQEARITIHKSMFDFMNKEIKQLMKKHDAYVNKGESDKTFTVISTPSASFEKDYSALMKKHKKKIIQHFKLESVDIAMPVVTTEDVQEDLSEGFLDRGKVLADVPDPKTGKPIFFIIQDNDGIKIVMDRAITKGTAGSISRGESVGEYTFEGFADYLAMNPGHFKKFLKAIKKVRL